MLFIGVVNGLKRRKFDLNTPLEEIVLMTSKADLAYVDDRRKAREDYGVDFWSGIDVREINKELLYSSSQQFPDFIFRIGKRKGRLTCGSLLELKDSKGGNIASFNS